MLFNLLVDKVVEMSIIETQPKEMYETKKTTENIHNKNKNNILNSFIKFYAVK